MKLIDAMTVFIDVSVLKCNCPRSLMDRRWSSKPAHASSNLAVDAVAEALYGVVATLTTVGFGDISPFGTADYIKGEITDKLTLERADEKTLLITALVREFCTKCKVSATIISDDMAGSMKVVGPNHRRINHETV